MSERKIHNYESVILVEKTIQDEGYNPNKLGRTSRKFIWASCRVCGESHRIRKGFYNKAGSACHKECRMQEQSQFGSPFSDPKVKKKAQENRTRNISQKELNRRISIGRKKAQSKIEETNMQKYGVRNTFQSGEIKEKIKKTNLDRYGVAHPMQSEDIASRAKGTVREKYGVDNVMQSEPIRSKAIETNKQRYGVANPMQDKDISEKSRAGFQTAVDEDLNDNYRLINTLRGDDFWNKMAEEELTLKELCDFFDINYQSATYRLVQDEFRDKYHKTYHFPKHQEQMSICRMIESCGVKVDANTRQVIPPLEIDIYCPESKLAIEFNGSYWHSEAFLDSSQSRHKHIEKTRMCREKGIELIHVFEHTYRERKDQILGFIQSALGSNTVRIHARKCNITHNDSSWFMNKHHVQGSTKSIKYFNLEYDGEIVGSMTAGKHHEKGGDRMACVLNRLAFKRGVTIQGGSGRLFKYFRQWAKGEGYDQIISWSDSSLTSGKVYNTLGFNMEVEHAPGYFYFDMKNGRYLSRQSQRKTNKLRPDGVTIREWNRARGLYPIWDCGKKKWTYHL